MLGHPADDFVEDFVGADRGVRRLTVTAIDRDHLEPLEGVTAGDLAGTVDVSATLEEALAAMLRDDKGVVGVKDGAQFLGVLTPAGIHQALRAALVEGGAASLACNCVSAHLDGRHRAEPHSLQSSTRSPGASTATSTPEPAIASANREPGVSNSRRWFAGISRRSPAGQSVPQCTGTAQRAPTRRTASAAWSDPGGRPRASVPNRRSAPAPGRPAPRP